MLCRDPLALAPRLDPASRPLAEARDRFASEEGPPPLPRGVPLAGLARLNRRQALAAFRSPLGPTT